MSVFTLTHTQTYKMKNNNAVLILILSTFMLATMSPCSESVVFVILKAQKMSAGAKLAPPLYVNGADETVWSTET